MIKLLSSASRIVLMLLTATICCAFLYLVIAGKIAIDPKDFFTLVLMVFAFFFGQKTQPNNPET